MPASRKRFWPLWLGWLCILLAAPRALAQDPAATEGPLSLALAPAAPLPPELLGRSVTRLEVVTEGGRWQASEQLRQTPLGQPLSAAYARAFLREILATGRYADASVSALPLGQGAKLRITVLPRRIVSELRVNGGSLDASLVLETAGVTAGEDVTVRSLAEVDGRIAELYRSRGFPSAVIATEAVDTDEPLHVVLNIVVEQGEPLLVSRLAFEVHPRMTGELRTLLDDYAIEAGDRLDNERLERADLDLVQRLRAEGYHDAAVEHRSEWSVDGYRLTLAVWAGAKMRLRFSGNDSFDGEDLARELEEPEDAERSPSALSERLRSFYVKRGFLDAMVSVERRVTSDGTLSDFWFRIRENARVSVRARHFPCITGQRSANDVGLEIDSFLSEALPSTGLVGPVDPNQLDSVVAPAPGGARVAPLTLEPWTTYDPGVYEKALEHVQGLYRSEGYLSARVGPVRELRRACDPRSPAQHCLPTGPRPVPTAECSPAASEAETTRGPITSCVPNPETGLRCEPEMEVSIPIRLGPRAILWDLGFEGNRSLVESELHEASGLTLGEPVSQLALEEARRRLVERYAEDGYAFAGIEVDLELSPDGTRAKAKFVISEREPVTVRDVVVRGAAFTDTDLILNRSALVKGQLYRRSWVRATEERLATLGVFGSVTVDLEDPEVPARQKVAVIRVQERLPQYLDVRPGFSTGEGLRVKFEYGHRNLAGRAIQFVLRVQLGYLPPALILDPSVRRTFQTVQDDESLLFLLERHNSATLEFPDIGLGPLYRLSLEGLDLRDITRDFAIEKRAAFATITYRPIRAVTVSFGVGLEFNEADLFLAGSNLDSWQDYLEANPNDPALQRLNVPDGLTLAVSQRLGVSWDRRDNSVSATRGTFMSLNLEHVNAFPIESSRSTTVSKGSEYKGNFIQYSGRIAGYLRLSERGLALATSFRFGFNQQIVSGSATYPDRYFFMGGVDSLRGFPFWSVVPEDLTRNLRRQADGGQLTAGSLPLRGGDLLINPRAELRIPVLGVWQAAVFLDTGNLWFDAAEVWNTFQLRYSAGAGLRINTPVGPLVLDYGINLDRRKPYEGFGAFHFSIGLF